MTIKLLGLIVLPGVLAAVAQAHVTTLRQEIGPYVVELGLRPDGIRAGQATEIFVRVLRESDDPKGSALSGVACSDLSARIAMPSMSSMPAIIPPVRWLGYAGSYALRTVLPHGGFYRVDLNFVPSQQRSALEVSYLVEVQDERADYLSAAARPFRLEVVSSPGKLLAGSSVHLQLVVWSEAKVKIARFETVHEKKLHLFLVREDLAEFFHEHPILEQDGTFNLKFQFPTAGTWVLFADVAPQGAGSQILSTRLVVSGAAVQRKPLTPLDNPILVRQKDILMRMESASPLTHRTNWLEVTLRDTEGHVPTGLEPWLGAAAHLILVEQDAATFVHSHPADSSLSLNQGTFTFEARFPKPGLYKAWLQVQRSGKVLTFSFVIRVLDSPLAVNVRERLRRTYKLEGFSVDAQRSLCNAPPPSAFWNAYEFRPDLLVSGSPVFSRDRGSVSGL